ncbi:hypothetical protein QQ045_028785 [Rhodiola kirilowii]
MAILVQQSKKERTAGKVFRFERMWLRDEQFKDVVTKWWTAPRSRALNFEEKLFCLQAQLSEWNKKHFGNVQTKINSLKKEIAEVQAQVESVGREAELTNMIDEWLHREEILWQQRSRVTWLQDGDNNSKFFHTYATSRKKRNIISILQRNNSTEATDLEESKAIIIDYYTNLFRSSHSVPQDLLKRKLSCIGRKVTDRHNSALLMPFSANEVTKAVFELHPSKAPGRDGFSAAFIQSCWQIVRDDFISECLSFLNDCILSDQANETLITLIPKQKEATKVTDYRPISLIGVKAKVISMVIVNRLQPILDEVISTE